MHLLGKQEREMPGEYYHRGGLSAGYDLCDHLIVCNTKLARGEVHVVILARMVVLVLVAAGVVV